MSAHHQENADELDLAIIKRAPSKDREFCCDFFSVKMVVLCISQGLDFLVETLGVYVCVYVLSGRYWLCFANQCSTCSLASSVVGGNIIGNVTCFLGLQTILSMHPFVKFTKRNQLTSWKERIKQHHLNSSSWGSPT